MGKVLIVLLLLSSSLVFGQSFEILPGNKRVFIDAQFLKYFDNSRSFSLFSRSRATSEYDGSSTDLFTGAYLNYTTNSGLGATVLGRISSSSSGIDAGTHYFKANKSFMLFALASVNLNDDLLYSWFSILRFYPEIKNDWKFYFSLELFSAFGQIGHLSSVQRVRIGLDRAGFQFGPAVNLRKPRSTDLDSNIGIFLSKRF